ncbi:kinase-like protein, partial [Patellaria atrata CBS 101060]
MEFTKGELSHIIYPSKQDVPLRHIAHLGHGSFAIVDKVKDKHRLVYARKLFQFSPHQKQRIVPEVEREVQILKRLRYQPHMVHFICSYEAGNNLGILVQPAAEYNLHQYMELYPELDSMYSGEGMFSARRTVERFFGCLASALGFLHNQSIRHKDIKPQNILVHKHQIYLTDFGLALDFAQLDGSFTSGTGNAFTRRYAAPEVLLGERRDRKADIFSLGCVFLEIYTTLCHQCTPED